MTFLAYLKYWFPRAWAFGCMIYACYIITILEPNLPLAMIERGSIGVSALLLFLGDDRK